MPISYTTGPPVSRTGVRSVILSNDSLTTGDELATWAARRLAVLQAPSVSYEIEATDLSRVRNDDNETVILGEPGMVVDDTLGLHVQVRLYEVHRNLDDPLDIRLVFDSRRRDIDDVVSEIAERIDDYSGPTEELPADKVNLPGGGTLDDWVGTDDAIDGGEIEDGTIDRLELAQVINRTSESAPQQYSVNLMNPSTRNVEGPQLTGCYVPDDTADEIPTGTEVLVLVRSDSAVANNEHHVIVQGGGGGGTTIMATQLTFTGTGF